MQLWAPPPLHICATISRWSSQVAWRPTRWRELASVIAKSASNGLGYDRNAIANAEMATADLLCAADMTRAGLAGSMCDYPLKTYCDEVMPLHRIEYAGRSDT